ncbi:MAG: hypothetical protein OXL34_09370 [Gemmatimonadota bacterium]|nr:hypothetical protein [Gemmatimonadota bacterium]
MKWKSWNSAQLLNALPLAVLLAVAGGCEVPTNPASGPGQVGHRLAVQPGAAGDRAALMALYDATDGENWKDNTNWGTDADLDEWYGVWTWDGRVDQLVIRDNGLSGQIPAALEGLTALGRLDLSYHPNLKGSIPPELGNLADLYGLVLVETSVSGGIPPELGNLSSLVYLDLRNEGMSGSIPPELGNLSSLEILYLYNNGMSGSIPPELGNLSSLRWLSLSRNSLSGSIPPELGNITGLEHLFLDDNQLSGGVPSSLGNLAALERLSLSRNRLTGALPSAFLNLYLAENEFSWWENRGLCIPNTAAFRAWMARMAFPDWSVNRSLCSADREALLGLHDALDGENWTDSNWGDDTDIRTWRGVTLDSDARATELRLGSSGLSGRIPNVLADLERLKVLVIEGNGLIGEVPESVMDLDLDVFWWSDNPGLCVPDTEAFRTWLGDMRSTSGPICGH